MCGEVGIAEYLSDYILEEGIEKFLLRTPLTVACCLKEPHLVKTDIIYLSKKKKGVWVFCPLHRDFFDVGTHEKVTSYGR